MWILFAKYDEEPNEGWCWIVYKGRVVEAYRNHRGEFRFHPYSDNCYLRDCITYCQYFARPEPPKEL